MAIFRCIACGAAGDFAEVDRDQLCPNCGSADGVRISMTMKDYPPGHPFWNELAGANDGTGEVRGSWPNKKVPT
jgi:hypothetical protein